MTPTIIQSSDGTLMSTINRIDTIATMTIPIMTTMVWTRNVDIARRARCRILEPERSLYFSGLYLCGGIALVNKRQPYSLQLGGVGRKGQHSLQRKLHLDSS